MKIIKILGDEKSYLLSNGEKVLISEYKNYKAKKEPEKVGTYIKTKKNKK